MSVEELLAGRAGVGAQLRGALGGIEELGVAVEQLELKDIVLPSDLKKAQAQVARYFEILTKRRSSRATDLTVRSPPRASGRTGIASE